MSKSMSDSVAGPSTYKRDYVIQLEKGIHR